MKMSKNAIYAKKGPKDPQILKTKSDLKKLKIGELFKFWTVIVNKFV